MSDINSNLAPDRPESVHATDSPLEYTIDDEIEHVDCREWIYRGLVDGRDADSLLAELVGNGWDTDDAEGMVEVGRRATRHLRGVITREEVARIAERRYRDAYRIAFRIAVGGLPLMCIYFLLWLTPSRNPWPKRNKPRRPQTADGFRTPDFGI